MHWFQSESTAALRRLSFDAISAAADGEFLADADLGTITVYLTKNNGTPATPSGGATVVETGSSNMEGRWYVQLAAADLSDIGDLGYRITADGMRPVSGVGEVWHPQRGTAGTALPAAAAEAAGGLYTRGAGAGQINQPANGYIDANVDLWGGDGVNPLIAGNVPGSVEAWRGVQPAVLDASNHVPARVKSVDNNAITAAAINTGAITNAKFAAGAIDAAALATDAATEIATAVRSGITTDHGAGSYVDTGAGGDATAANQATIIAYVDSLETEVAAIKAKTDLIPADPATVTKQNLILAAIAAIDIPTPAEIDAELTAAHDAGSWAGGGDATAANQATILANLAAVASDVIDVAGLLHRNALVDNTIYVDGFLMSARLRVFANAAALASATAGAANGSDSEIRRFVIVGEDEGNGTVKTFKISRTL